MRAYSCSNMNDFIKEIWNKYFSKLDTKTVVVLIGSALFLMLYRHYCRRHFFHTSLSQYFAGNSLMPILSYYYWFLSSTIMLMFLPLLTIKLIFKERVQDWGFRFGKKRFGFTFVIVAYVLMIVVLFLVSRMSSFQKAYPLCKFALNNWKLFVTYEIAYGIYMFAWEFIFRGYMLFGMEKALGNYTIFVQMIPFAIMHSGKPLPEALGAVFTGILLGVVALYTRSFLYGVILHILVAITMDVIVGFPVLGETVATPIK